MLSYFATLPTTAWAVYRKWNERLFEEMARTFNAGRSENRPGKRLSSVYRLVFVLSSMVVVLALLHIDASHSFSFISVEEINPV